MSLPGEPRWENPVDVDGEARLRPLASEDAGADDASGDAGIVAEVIWHGGGTRDAYEALLRALFAPGGTAP